ncbi:Single-stranded DNA-binding protein [Neorhizobium galegae bv. officinalis]|nr:Single-stranded DNA-binding protein [Neorhizobium galegae bv. officinalis]
MSGSMNRATLLGHLGADPEIRRTQDGRPIATFSLATSESWRDRNTGEKRELTEWHRVVIFNEALAKVAEQYLKKGSQVLVEGQIKTRKWQDQQGQDRYSTEIVLQAYNASLTMTGGGGNGSGYRQGGNGPGDYGYEPDRAAGQSSRPASSSSSSENFSRDLDDDIPF